MFVAILLYWFLCMQNGYEFQREYEALLSQSMDPPLNVTSQSIYGQQCYDAVWTLARALNRTIQGNKTAIC